jgi:phosphatidyl-myo-inositol alpha-mannosyltransferase
MSLGGGDSQRLKIALVYDDSLDRVGGVSQYVITLAKGLRARGHDVSLLVGDSSRRCVGGSPVHSLSRNLAVRFNGNRLTMPVASRAAAIDSALARSRFDVIHVQVPYSPLMAGRVIHRAGPRPAVVGTFHVASERRLPRIGAKILAATTIRTLRRFDAMMSVSKTAAGFARSTFGVDSSVVPNMVDLESIRAMDDVGRARTDAPLIAYLGALVERKGPDRLLAAFSEVHHSAPKARLLIAGEGPMRGRLERTASRGPAGSRIRFTGPVSEYEKFSLLRSARIACFPARFGESFGIVLLEAMAAGSGVVLAGDNQGYRELMQACPGAVCPGVDSELAARLLLLLEDGEERRRLHRQQQRLVEDFDLDKVTDRLLDVYRAATYRRSHMHRLGTDLPSTEPALEPA